MLKMLAPAKINLLLSVGRRQASGLHEVVSIMQSVSLFDEVSVAPAEDFTCTVEGIVADVPIDDENLATRAARAFATLHLDAGQGVAVHLRKAIPPGGGLGGASTDAAAVLVGLKEATGGGVSRKTLERLAGPLGSDVPFSVRGGTCVVEGTGERLTTLPVRPQLWWVLGLTGIHCSTAAVYAMFDEMAVASGSKVQATELTGDPHAMADALARGDLEQVAKTMSNDLEAPALNLYPALAAGKDALLEAGARSAMLTGSGSSWLGLCGSQQEADAVANSATGFASVHVVHSLGHGPRPAED